MRTAIASVLFAAAASASGACDFTAFETYRTRTPVISIPSPDNYPGGSFGTLVAFTSNDNDRDWLIGSGGLGSAVAVTPLRNGTTFPTQNDGTYVCSASMQCNNTTQTGVALEGITTWAGSTACVATGAFGTVHQVHLACIGDAAPREFAISPPAGFLESGFGLAMAAVHKRRADDPNTGEILFVGARAGTGHVFAAQPNSVVDFTPTDVPREAGLGSAMAAGVLRAGGAVSNLIVVAGAPTIRGVMVFRGDPRAGRPMVRVGCMLRDEAGFGGTVATGDVDGDGSEDVIVGSSDVMGRVPRIHVYLASAIPSGTTLCDSVSWPEAGAMECADVPDRNVRCAGPEGLFGSTLAAGDLDADGKAEIIVGAPRAQVEDRDRAGAVWLLRATVRGPNAIDLATAGVLRSSNPELGVELGTSVVSPHMGTRDEVIAGAPAIGTAVLFLCSGIPGDLPNMGGLDAQCR